MKKILFVMYSPLDKGGIQNTVMNIVRHLHKEYQFDAMVLSSECGYYDKEFISYGGELFKEEYKIANKQINKKIAYYLRGIFLYKTIAGCIKHHGPYEAVHCNIAEEAGIASRAARECNVPIRIAHSHVAFVSQYNPIAKIYITILKRLIKQNATSCVACSDAAGLKLFENNAYQIIYNTVDRKFFDNTIPQTIHKAPHLLQVGLICDNKNQMFTLDVLKALQVKYPESQLVIIGSPKDSSMERYYNKIKEKTQEEGMHESVNFLPADSDVKAEMQKADYLMLPSRHEGLPIVALEAQSVGMKCFASTGVPVEVDCGGCIFLSLNNGAESWANRIAQQFEEDHGARQKYDMSRFMPDVIMEQYRKLYRGELD